jgi:hypoxanthine phosphoribosyltransferase
MVKDAGRDKGGEGRATDQDRIRRAVPPYLEEILSPAAIREGIAAAAERVAAWCRAVLDTEGKQVLAVCVLRGGIFFFSDLLQQLPVTVEPAFCRCASYAKHENDAPQAWVEVELYDLALAGRFILLVDNICDSGRTLQTLTARCAGEGAAAVRSVSLIRRVRADALARPDWSVFEIADPAWLVGYGLRDRDCLMNYPGIYRVTG